MSGDVGLSALAGAVRGRVLRPGDDGYDSARRVFNAMIDRHPEAIVRCAGVDDVVAAVNHARDAGLPLSVKGGGHSVAGTAVCDGGIMVDLSPMKDLAIDPTAAVAAAGPGLTLGEFDAGTEAFGLATTTGVVSMTGLAGLTLGGGIGWLNGRYGLACDNLIGAEVVTAAGQVLTADATNHDDLFWALRGGGGNFGVVTSFRYRLHPVPAVLGGGVTFPAAQARAALRFYHEFACGAPDDLSTAASVSLDAEGRPAVSVGLGWCGPIERGEAVVAPLRRFGPPVVDAISPMSYTTLQSSADGGYPVGRLHYWKAGFLAEIDDDVIDVLLAFAEAMPSPFTGIGLQELCGVASRVPATATAFPHRAHHYDCLILSQWDDPADSARNIAWTRELFAALQPFLAGGVYANNLGAEETDRVAAAYGPNYDRLAAVKAAYDPGNLFRLNHNIVPAASAR